MALLRRVHLRVLLLVAACVVVAAFGARLALAHDAAPIGTGVAVIETDLGYSNAAAAGTGIVLTSSGEVLTNNHVIDGATSIKVVFPDTGHSYTARVVGYDVADDVALLRLEGASNLKTLPVAGSSTLTVGATVTALGNAGGTGRLTTATGTITGLRRTITAGDGQGSSERLTGMIEIDAGVQSGDSGGPLLDRSGRVVGMDTAASTGHGFQTAAAVDAYAIPIGKALQIVRQIEAGRASARVHIGGTAFLGVELESVGAAGYGYGFGGYGSTPTSGGALVAGIVSDGPAAAAGLETGDVITAVDGRKVTSPGAITALILAKKPGATVTVRYVDQTGTASTAKVRLGSGPPR